jgi:hypothetical protein
VRAAVVDAVFVLRRSLPHQGACLFLSASWIRESPKPNTENCGDDNRDPAYAHRNGTGPDNDLSVHYQAREMTDGKEAENDARDA